tara:strand:- start:5958 stop:6317 length:360 start_codon:yes stop_codon:yes gene_type:complete
MGNVFDYVFITTLYSMFVLIWLVILGIGKFAPQYLGPVQTFLKLYIGGLLFVRYNPATYKDRNFREFDRKIVFTCSIFLLLSTALIGGIKNWIVKEAAPHVNEAVDTVKDKIGLESKED